MKQAEASCLQSDPGTSFEMKTKIFAAVEMTLSGRRILVVEDDYLISMDVLDALSQAGAEVVGPVAKLSSALCHIEHGSFDAAVLDIKLNDGLVFPAADRLANSGVPFVFLSGYDSQFIPERFSTIPLFLKPYDDSVLVEGLCGLLSVSCRKASSQRVCT